MPYIGRFAPSPTGPLHFGSLVAALASYLDAKANQGKWLLRMEDLDKPREVTGAADHILRTLQAFGFEWDGPVVYQSNNIDQYESVLADLSFQGFVYPCTCSRKAIAEEATHQGIEGFIYPKTCLRQPVNPNKTPAWRIQVTDCVIGFDDVVQGNVQHALMHDIGDFILKRADGIFSYQLAVIVDDAAAKITNIVRGADLLDSTTRQIYLQQLLHYQTPHYLHIPIASNAIGQKLSKQTLAEALDTSQAPMYLWQAADFLNQHPPVALKTESLNTFWKWAIKQWQPSLIPSKLKLTL